MFQPHRYTRTAALKEEFGRAFRDAAAAFITDIYPASEPPIDGVTGQTIVDELVRDGHPAAQYVPDRKRLALAVGKILQPGDCVVSLGAGSIHEQADVLARDLARFEEIQRIMGPGVCKLYEPLSRHTTMCIGGPAQFWAVPETEEGLARLREYCQEWTVPLFVMGRGSNLLVRDGGIRGVVVFLGRGEFKKIEVRGGQIMAGAGVLLRELAIAARDAQLGGFEWFEGIPGSVGGGAPHECRRDGRRDLSPGRERALRRSERRTFTRAPRARWRCTTARCLRSSATSPSPPPSSATRARRRRSRACSSSPRTSAAPRQPRESSAGCIFKNPGPTPAGKLVDELGLKGTRVGGARVSEIHGNFIVNDHRASANDVLQLIEQIRAVARRERGLELETEVQIVGEEKGIHE